MATNTISQRPASPSAIGIVVGAMLIGTCILLWSGVTLTFDGLWASGLVRQVQATHYRTAVGRIVERHRDGHNGTSYTAKFRYAYEVNGCLYAGDRLRYGLNTSGSRAARAAVAERPNGSIVTVYYNPSAPNDSVLSPGVDGPDLFMPMFLTPFNLIMLTFWWGMLGWFARKLRGPAEAGGAPIRQRGPLLQIRLPKITPLVAFAITLLASTFAMTMILAFASRGAPATDTILLGWTAVVVITGYVTLKVAVPTWRGDRDLVIDPMSRRLMLPRTFGRTEPVELRFTDVIAADLDHQQTTDNEGNTHHTYVVNLRYRTGAAVQTESAATLVKWSNADNAKALADWLRKNLGLTCRRPSP